MRRRGGHWRRRFLVAALGAAVTASILVITVFVKFGEGGWFTFFSVSTSILVNPDTISSTGGVLRLALYHSTPRRSARRNFAAAVAHAHHLAGQHGGASESDQ